MAEVVVDANVLVGLLDQHDSLHGRANALLDRLKAEGHIPLVVDLALCEPVSVVCRRAQERKTHPPSLARALARARAWHAGGEVEFVGQHVERLFGTVLDIVEETAGKLNVNDALLVALQREGAIGDVASFDPDLDAAKGFRRISS